MALGLAGCLSVGVSAPATPTPPPAPGAPASRGTFPFAAPSPASPLTLAPTPRANKPGPPPGTALATPGPTPTVAPAVPPAEWQEVVLPPPPGSESIVPPGIAVPTVRLALPKTWSYTTQPGMYLVQPGPEPTAPALTISLAQPFANWGEPVPADMEGFVQTLAHGYSRAYGLPATRVERLPVDGREAVALYLPQGEACLELFVPLPGRYDVAYRFTFLRSLCRADGRLIETGQRLLESIRFAD